MPKKNIEDMVVPEKRRTIRDIPIPTRRTSPMKSQSTETPSPTPTPEFTPNMMKPQVPTPSYGSEFEDSKAKTPRRGLWVSIGLSLIIVIFAVLSVFNGATLTYVPKTASLSFNKEVFTASKSGIEGVPFSVVKLSGEESITVPASGKADVSRKASGTIVVYNETNRSIRLREETRFENSEGKVYMVEDPITVPKSQTVDGESVPGSLEIVVNAENPGVEYNIGLDDFTLPGLSGSALFSDMYARSKTAMTGGFLGEEAVVSEGVGAQGLRELETKLRERFVSDAREQVPEGFVLVPALSKVSFQSLSQSPSADASSATLNMQGDFQGAMFKEVELYSHIAGDQIKLNPSETIDIPNLETLEFSFASSTFGNLASLETIDFSVSGQSEAQWNLDIASLKADLSGKNKNDVSSILNNYPSIISATSTIRPFWKSSFPGNVSRIIIKQAETN